MFMHGNFKDYLLLNTNALQTLLLEYEQEIIHQTTKKSLKLLPFIKIFFNHCQGGKRIRAALVTLGYEITNSPENKDILKAALAIEIFQTAILAHDDIIDLSPLRRGKPTMYKELGGDHYGISQTICIGDIGMFLSNKILCQTKFPAEYRIKAIETFQNIMTDTGFGEILDVYLPHNKDSHSDENEVITISKLKTARYTIGGPLQIGAILGGANEKTTEKLGKFGDNLGIAFQIHDDILGVFGDEKVLGKSTISDIEEGKITLMYIYARKNASPSQLAQLEQIYGRPGCTNEMSAIIKEIFLSTQAFEYASTQAQTYIQQAKALIPEITSDQGHQSTLHQLCDFLIKREK